MITIILRDEEYQMPTKFEEVNLDKYMSIIQIPKDVTEVERLIKVLSILTEIPEVDIRNVDIHQVQTMSNHIQFLFKQESHLLVEQIEINGVWYGFNKNLDNITFGEYIDLEQMGEKLNENLHVLMAILYRPIIKRHKNTNLKNFIEKNIYKKEVEYKIEEYKTKEVMERADIFRRYMTIDTVLGAMFFFTILKLLYIENFRSSLQKKKMTKKEMLRWTIEKMKEFGVSFKPTGDG